MEEKKMPTWLVILLIVVGLCLVGFGTWYGVSHFKGEPEGPTPESSTEESAKETPGQSITCEDKTFIISKDSKEKIPEIKKGTGWTGGGAGITFYLNDDKSLDYEVWLDGCNKYDESASDVGDACLENKTVTRYIHTEYKCDYLFENDEGLTSKVEDPIPYGICYSNGKYYELGLRELSGNTTDVNSWKPYIEDITEYCKTN
jgi:hypothetical protein